MLMLRRILVFSVLLTGNLVFMSYRAAITSDLAVWSIKMPFDSLPGLLETDYRLRTLAGGLMQVLWNCRMHPNVLPNPTRQPNLTKFVTVLTYCYNNSRSFHISFARHTCQHCNVLNIKYYA